MPLTKTEQPCSSFLQSVQLTECQRIVLLTLFSFFFALTYSCHHSRMHTQNQICQRLYHCPKCYSHDYSYWLRKRSTIQRTFPNTQPINKWIVPTGYHFSYILFGTWHKDIVHVWQGRWRRHWSRGQGFWVIFVSSLYLLHCYWSAVLGTFLAVCLLDYGTEAPHDAQKSSLHRLSCHYQQMSALQKFRKAWDATSLSRKV